jgi:hydrogenase nickel incorporation protein HypB
MAKLEIKQDMTALNKRLAQENRDLFAAGGIFVINMIGSPGAGKTTLLENILPALKRKWRIAVIEGDLATQNDALRIRQTGVPAVQINTNGACHLDARMISREIAQIDVESIDLLIIENVGNLICPSSFDLGEDMRIVVLSIAEGEDKPSKYPVAFLHADAAVITKTDLLPYIRADLAVMRRQIAEINPTTTIFETSIQNETYLAGPFISHIEAMAGLKRAGQAAVCRRSTPRSTD